MRRGASVLAVTMLTACQPSATTAPAGSVGSVGLPGLSLVPAAGGLDVAGSGGREIGFGRDQLGALQTVTRIEGAAPRLSTCDAPLRQAYVTQSGLTLVFEAGKFVGWATQAASAGRVCS